MKGGFPLNKEVLRAAYEYLRLMPPFNRWRLPPGDQVRFQVTRDVKANGWHKIINGVHVIGISSRNVGRHEMLLQTMAHEMCHVRCREIGVRAAHGSDFKRCAALVCKHHKFDALQF